MENAPRVTEQARRARHVGPHGPRGPHVRFSGEKAKDLKGSLRRLLGFMAQFRASLLLVFIFAIGSTLFNIIGPKVLSTATTELFVGLAALVEGAGGIDFQAIGAILLASLVLFVLSAACSFVQSWVMSGVSQRTCYRLRGEIAKKIDRMPFGYFEKNSVGDVLSRITNDVDTLGQSLNQGLTQLITSITTVVGVLAMMLWINPIMALVTLLIVPITLVFTSVVVKKSQGHFVRQQAMLGEANALVEETFGGHAVVRAFNREERELTRFREVNQKLYESGWKSQFLSGVMKPVIDLVGNAGYVVIAILGCFFAIQGIITVGDIQAFIQYVKNFTQPLSQLAQVANVLQQMAAAAERIFEFLDEPEEDDASVLVACARMDADDALESMQAPAAGAEHFARTVADVAEESSEANALDTLSCDVEFDHVRFGYDPDKPIIRDFCATVKESQTVALVGPAGAGKTTMVKLLMRFYDVQGGAIRLGGRDLRDLSREQIRSRVGMVVQETWLYKASIRENIRYGNLEATDAQVEQAARDAYAHEFIMQLPGGYDFVINEDASNVSQGQRQLLTIARAFLANRRMMILDEATSSVDTLTEIHIQEAMDRLMKDRTAFVIAHRLSTIRNADLILVLDAGDVVEQGTHAQLLERGGFYASLYNAQFSGMDLE